MEQEFKKTGQSQSPAFGKLLIQGLRKTREEHPVLDFAAGNLPIVGGLQTAMDVSDPEASIIDRSMGALSLIPGGKLLQRVLPKKKYRLPEIEEHSKTPSTTPPDVVAEANRQYAEQLLKEGDSIDMEKMAALIKRIRDL